jgi:hypothetical protein
MRHLGRGSLDIAKGRRGKPSNRYWARALTGDVELSDLLWCARLWVVQHESSDRAVLKELARTYVNPVEDGTRVMHRLKMLFRARGIRTAGRRVLRDEVRP